MKTRRIVLSVLFILVFLLALPSLIRVLSNLNSDQNGSPEPTDVVTPMSVSVMCTPSLFHADELVGKELLVKLVTEETFCFTDMTTGDTYTVVRLDMNGDYYWENVSFFQDSHGLTGKSQWMITPGQQGVVEKFIVNGDEARYHLVSKDDTFEKVYGTPQDIKFLGVWNGFRADVIKYASDIQTMPHWMNHQDFSVNFTPQDACWWAKEYSASVKIDEEFSFCQYDQKYNGHVNVSGSYIALTENPFSSLIAVLPNLDENPRLLPIDGEIGGLKLVGCYPIEGQDKYDDGFFLYFTHDEVKYSSWQTEEDYYINPIGVIFDLNGKTVGDIVPFKSLLKYDWVPDGAGSGKHLLFKFSSECDPSLMK